MHDKGNNEKTEKRNMIARTSYDFMRRRYYERAADPSQNPTWLQHGGTIILTFGVILLMFHAC